MAFSPLPSPDQERRKSASDEIKAILSGTYSTILKIISIGNHMISSAIWDKSARVNFSKTNKIARARRASAICSL